MPAGERPVSGAELAARIEIPLQLPVRYDGERLRHLSQSSVGLWYRCPEAFRRRYILGEPESSNSTMFLGTCVDDTLTHYYRTLLTTGESVALEELREFYEANWRELREREEAGRGIDWTELDPKTAYDTGVEAVGVCRERLVPQLGRPVAIQRRFEFALTPRCEWVVTGYIDLETRSEQLENDGPVETVVDWKVKGDPVRQDRADGDVQASLYLTARWIEGDPADQFVFAQLLRPGKKRTKVGSAITRTTRTVGQMRAIRARVALAASQIVATYERYGAERPWGYAEPTHWQCSPRFCAHWADCPGGAGL
jgi:hypothetical protein